PPCAACRRGRRTGRALRGVGMRPTLWLVVFPFCETGAPAGRARAVAATSDDAQLDGQPAAVKRCNPHRCKRAIETRVATTCAGMHGKPSRRCRKAGQKAERNAVLADCRNDLCSCEGGSKSTCALPPPTTTSTTPPTTAPATVPTTSTTAPTTLTPTSTTAPPTAPTTTTLPGRTPSNPGAGLQSQITGATVSAAGTVVVTFTLT